MKIRKRIILMLLCGSITTGLVSCNKFLDVKPEDRFLAEDVFKDELSVHNALNGIYLNLAKPDLYGGELTMGSIDVMAQYYNISSYDFWGKFTNYNYTDLDSKATFSSIWQSAYRAILNTNSFLSKVDQSPSVLSDSRRDLFKGEAFGLRAFLHFDMLRLFGPVYLNNPGQTSIPYLTTATEKIQPLLPANVIVDSVLADLGRAELLLKNDPIRTEGVVAVDGTDPLNDFIKLRNRRCNYYAVLGIKARVLLYKGDKAGALAAATKVIEEAGKWFRWTPGSQTMPGLGNPDRIFSQEVVFGVQNYDLYNQQRALFAATLQANFILAPTTNRLTEVFENNENDYRYRINWVLGTTEGKGYKTFVKYEDVINKDLLFRNLQPLFRISELYYIAAECTDDPNLALKYINTVRANRGLPDLAANANLNTALQKEYCKEFWGEGQMFFYYKRKAITTIPAGNGGDMLMNDAKYVVPLPDSETLNR